MGYYELVATIQRDRSQPQEEEVVRILQVSGTTDKELLCIDKYHERITLEIKDNYESNKPGVVMKRLVTKTPTSLKEKITTRQTKIRNLFLIKEGLREIKEDIIKKVYQSTPKRVVETESCGTNLMYLTLESVTIPITTFTGELTKVSFFEKGAAILEVATKERNFSVIRKATNFENFIKEIFTINASSPVTTTQIFNRSTDEQIAALSTIEDLVSSPKPEERAPLSEVQPKNFRESRELQPYTYKPYKPLEKEFFFKEFSGASDG